jgi:hypothetical protein
LQDIELARISQEVTERFYNLLAVGEGGRCFAQLRVVMTAAQPLTPDKRAVLLQRVAGQLGSLGSRRVGDADVERAVMVSLRGLLHAPAA